MPATEMLGFVGGLNFGETPCDLALIEIQVGVYELTFWNVWFYWFRYGEYSTAREARLPGIEHLAQRLPASFLGSFQKPPGSPFKQPCMCSTVHRLHRVCDVEAQSWR